MEQKNFITELDIVKVRHLQNICIPLASDVRKHLILTGKNGSGKTSVLKAFSNHLEYLVSSKFETQQELEKKIATFENQLNKLEQTENEFSKQERYNSALLNALKAFENWSEGAIAKYSSIANLRDKYKNGEFILAYYGDNRYMNVKVPKNIEKIQLQTVYSIGSHPGQDFIKYLVNLKTKLAFAQTDGNSALVNSIKDWFDRFQKILCNLYDDKDLALEFNTDTFEFFICMNDREPFDFNSMSMGYSAVFDIICDLIMRMEPKQNYNLEGIVLIDEIETHLHIELQRKIMPILIDLFPNIQFILTTHSPFILNSMNNAVVYDLETQTLIEEGLSNYTYNGIVEGFFDVDALSAELRQKFDRYKELITKDSISDIDFAEIAEIQIYLDEVPDRLALEFMPEYKRLKLEFKNRTR